MNDIVCKVCGDKFMPCRSKRYEVVIPSMMGPSMIGEAFDCPYCGCQHVVNKKYMPTDAYDFLAVRKGDRL
jgi:hypothetical protein